MDFSESTVKNNLITPCCLVIVHQEYWRKERRCTDLLTEGLNCPYCRTAIPKKSTDNTYLDGRANTILSSFQKCTALYVRRAFLALLIEHSQTLLLSNPAPSTTPAVTPNTAVHTAAQGAIPKAVVSTDPISLMISSLSLDIQKLFRDNQIATRLIATAYRGGGSVKLSARILSLTDLIGTLSKSRLIACLRMRLHSTGNIRC